MVDEPSLGASSGVAGVTLSLASIVTDDIEALSAFYARVFDLHEIVEFRSDVFRGLDLAGVTLGFSAPAAYELLGLEEYRDASGTRQFLTFEALSDADVDALTERAVALGATLLQAPSETYYGAWQSVLADPDGNPFRINHFRA